LIADLAHVTTQEFKNVDDLIYVLGETKADFNGSELQKMTLGLIEGKLMDFDLAIEKEIQQLVLTAIQSGLIESAHDCSEGGLGVALAECSFKHDFGLEVELDMPTCFLFSETQSRFVLTVKPENQSKFEKRMNGKAHLIGKVTDNGFVSIQMNDQKIEILTQTAKELWEEAIPCLMK